MRWFPLVAFILATPAYAQSPAIEATCMTVAKNFFMTETLNVGVVQSFPELKPPGARFTYAERPDTKKADMSDTFDCEFDSGNVPYKLVRFCVSSVCYSNDQEDGERKRRFEEMQVLLHRSGNSN